MAIPKRIKKKDGIYTLVKKYPHFVLYENEYGIRECMLYYDLGSRTYQAVTKKNIFIGNHI